jgi:hypothetical protein
MLLRRLTPAFMRQWPRSRRRAAEEPIVSEARVPGFGRRRGERNLT